jgi:hypothetical protein
MGGNGLSWDWVVGIFTKDACFMQKYSMHSIYYLLYDSDGRYESLTETALSQALRSAAVSASYPSGSPPFSPLGPRRPN